VLVAVEPMFSESQLTRALIAAAAAGIPATIVLNKTDLPRRRRAAAGALCAMGVPRCWNCRSRPTPRARWRCCGTRLLAGNDAGAGPQRHGQEHAHQPLVPAARAQVGEISQALPAGRHTTTTTTWYWLDDAAAAR
jgi:ribosome biogenesis GTPase